MSLNKQKKDKLRKKFKTFSAIFKLMLLLIILVGLPLYIYFFQHDIIEQFSSLDQVEAFFNEYKTKSIFIYIAFQVIQIIICVIPGQALQFTAGYMYGFWMGYLWSFVGALIGTVATYYIAKVLGHDAMHLIFGEERIKSMLKTFNSKRAMILIFLFYLIPGLPKDLCSYVAGLSEMKLKPFLIISLVGRTPAMMGSLLIGKLVNTGGYTGAIIIAVIAVILFVVGVVLRKRIMGWIDTAYDKLIHM